MNAVNESGRLMFYVYILQSVDSPERFYVGCTNDLKRRMKEHNDGKSLYTKKFRPWTLHGHMAFDSEEKAQRFEKFLKSGNGRIFQRKFF